MKEIKSLIVTYHGKEVGILAETKDGKGAFQYNKEWLLHGFSISPFSLPLEDKVFVPKKDTFDGMFGVFSDSLPDGWGKLLVDRMLLAKKVSAAMITQIQRLGIVGKAGMGALEYSPELLQFDENEKVNLDRLSQECEKILQEKESKDLDTLAKLGASSGGARPKVLIKMEGEDWIVKFPSSYDPKTIGEEEFQYMQCAEKCGIEVPEVKLLPSHLYTGYFAVKRFDRGEEKRHMITVSGLLETSHRYPNLDYRDLMKLTYILTKDCRQVEEMYRRMCFNIYAHNRDDHSKNFSYIYNEKKQKWELSPVYDLTFSESIGGEHATCVNGNGKNPSLEDILEVAKAAGLAASFAKKTAKQIEEIVYEELSVRRTDFMKDV